MRLQPLQKFNAVPGKGLTAYLDNTQISVGNLAVIGEATTLPLLRPLVGMDKEEISRTAERIGTFETSIIPDQDCCQVFVPRHPSTRARPDAVRAAEARYDVPGLVAMAVAATERVRFRYPETASATTAVAAITR